MCIRDSTESEKVDEVKKKSKKSKRGKKTEISTVQISKEYTTELEDTSCELKIDDFKIDDASNIVLDVQNLNNNTITISACQSAEVSTPLDMLSSDTEQVPVTKRMKKDKKTKRLKHPEKAVSYTHLDVYKRQVCTSG